MYAVVDIETTGGKFNEEGITEIAIYKYDGHEIVDQFISLVNPEKDIQPFVVRLTGINNKMLRNAPKFHDVAKRIVEITENCILIAHNTSFDYRILRTEFRRLGYDFTRKTLCTVELSKKLLPNQEKYSLGVLVKALGIPLSDRHRASGDALATVKLFKLLLDKDSSKDIINSSIKEHTNPNTPVKFNNILDELPNKMGVYYIQQSDGKIIYIGKHKNIKKGVRQLFIGQSRIAKSIQQKVTHVRYEKTGSALVNIIKEQHELAENKPILNSKKRQQVFYFGAYKQLNEQGYYSIYIGKIDGRKKAITLFTSSAEANLFLTKVTNKYNLCSAVNKINTPLLPQTTEDTNTYNNRVNTFLEEYHLKYLNISILDYGRTPNEQSVLLIENGIFKGYGFCQLNYQINKLSILKELITPMNDSAKAIHIIQSYLRRKKVKKIIPLQNV